VEGGCGEGGGERFLDTPERLGAVCMTGISIMKRHDGLSEGGGSKEGGRGSSLDLGKGVKVGKPCWCWE